MARLDQTPFEIDILDLSHDGRGVARRPEGQANPGKAVFVSGALPGERVLAQQTGRQRSFDEAKTLQVLQASVDRVEPRCPHFGTCGGCALQHLEESRQIHAKQRVLLENLERIGHVVPESVLPPLTDAAWGYRRKGRFSVRRVEKKDKTLVGFREQDPRFVADLSVCHTVIPQIGFKVDALAALVDGLQARREIPQIEFIAGDDTVALVFRHLMPLTERDRALGGDRGVEPPRGRRRHDLRSGADVDAQVDAVWQPIEIADEPQPSRRLDLAGVPDSQLAAPRCVEQPRARLGRELDARAAQRPFAVQVLERVLADDELDRWHEPRAGLGRFDERRIEPDRPREAGREQRQADVPPGQLDRARGDAPSEVRRDPPAIRRDPDPVRAGRYDHDVAHRGGHERQPVAHPRAWHRLRVPAARRRGGCRRDRRHQGHAHSRDGCSDAVLQAHRVTAEAASGR